MSFAREESGFSLAELLVATAVAGLVMAALLGLVQAGVGGYRWGSARIEAQQSARIALERMARELREAGYDPTGAGLAAVVTAEPTRVVFQRDLDGDGVLDPTREQVAYLLRPGESVLRRDAGGGAQPIINGVQRLLLVYFDAAGRTTTDPAAVAAVQIQIEVGLGASAVAMQTRATLRNVVG